MQYNAGRCFVSMWICADRDNFHKVFSDLIARRRAILKAKNIDGVTDAAKNVENLVDAAFALDLPEQTIIADLVAHFVVGFYANSSRESAVLPM